ncbi:GNAT family N-acetyltransferase [Aminobacter ciceronei]|jgi:RimJ/RimL family protein N-acetyltransferase|uniref:GNAT family N-acetyltransferase n=1 Tax=Aminobacter ciceronei TaxID=150723 RepID=UPI003F6E7193
MIIEATAHDFAVLLRGAAPNDLRLVPDSAIAPPEVLQMLADLAGAIRTGFAPAAWLIVEDGELVGLCSVARPPEDGEVHIGYGVAASRQGRGAATRAIAELLTWAGADPRVGRVTAETGVDNLASQRVLERNDFVRIGERLDVEDGRLICWQAVTD